MHVVAIRRRRKSFSSFWGTLSSGAIPAPGDRLNHRPWRASGAITAWRAHQSRPSCTSSQPLRPAASSQQKLGVTRAPHAGGHDQHRPDSAAYSQAPGLTPAEQSAGAGRDAGAPTQVGMMSTDPGLSSFRMCARMASRLAPLSLTCARRCSQLACVHAASIRGHRMPASAGRWCAGLHAGCTKVVSPQGMSTPVLRPWQLG